MASPHSHKTPPDTVAFHPRFSAGESRARLAYVRAIAWHWMGRLAGGFGRAVELAVCVSLLLPLGVVLGVAQMAALASGGGLQIGRASCRKECRSGVVLEPEDNKT